MSSSSSTSLLLQHASRSSSSIVPSPSLMSRMKSFIRRHTPFMAENRPRSPPTIHRPLLQNKLDLVALEEELSTLQVTISQFHNEASDIYNAFVGQISPAFTLSGGGIFLVSPVMSYEAAIAFMCITVGGFLCAFIASAFLMFVGINAKLPQMREIHRQKNEIIRRAHQILDSESGRLAALVGAATAEESVDVLDNSDTVESVMRRSQEIVNSGSGIHIKRNYIILLISTTICVIAYITELCYIIYHSPHRDNRCFLN